MLKRQRLRMKTFGFFQYFAVKVATMCSSLLKTVAYILPILISTIVQSIPYVDCSQDDRINLTLFAISNIDTTSGKDIVGGQWLYIQQINNDPTILSDYCLILEGTSLSILESVTFNHFQHTQNE